MSKFLRLTGPTSTALVVSLLSQASYAAQCGNVKVSSALGGCNSSASNPIYGLLERIIQFATGIFALVFVLMIVIAGLQYVVSDGSPDIAKEAKDRIKNAITGFVLFALMWGVLQIIIPKSEHIFG